MEAKPRCLILLSILAIVVASGCTGLDPQTLATANPMIQQFLDEHPNAKILVTHFTAEQARNMLDVIRTDCDNPYIDEKEFYRVNITDPDTDFYAVVWIDWNSKVVECAYKLGTEGKVIEKPKPEPGCESHASYKCDSGHLYWFDSCGNKQEKRLYCKYGCSENQCLGECRSQAEYRCYGDHVYWFDSCGNKQEKKEYCNYGCNEGFCKPAPAERTCEQAGGYCVWPQAVANSETSASGGGGGGQAAATGMIVAAETTATSSVVSYQCRDGYEASPRYFCKEGGMCCLPETTPTEFCGSSTQGFCASNSDCVTGGCSGQVCQSVQEEPAITTCEYKDCYNSAKYGMACKCIIDSVTPAATAAIIGESAAQGRCKWTRTTACTEEAKICPDGTAVGRNPNKNCEFYPCPTSVNSTCGNGICDTGESGNCPSCSYENPPCPTVAICHKAACPQDCLHICSDSDGGKNYYVKGIVSGFAKSSILSEYTFPSSQEKLNVINNNTANLTLIGEYGFTESKMVMIGETYTYSTTTLRIESLEYLGPNNKENSVNVNVVDVRDFCMNGSNLIEVFCENNTFKNELFVCPNGCSEGRCL